MRILIAAAACLGFAVAAHAAEISDDAAVELASQFSVMESIYARQGAALTRLSEARGVLAPEAVEDVTINLDGPGTYVIVGLCDAGCRNLNLRIFDSRGTLIDEDAAADANPVVHIETNDSAQVRVQAVMARCRQDSCAYGVNVYQH